MDAIDTTRLAVAIISTAALAAGAAALVWGDAAPVGGVNGDVVGQDADESVESYRARASTSVEEALAGDDTPAFALVSFRKPLDASTVGAIVQPAVRVNAVAVVDMPAIGIPEPVVTSRAQCLFQQLTLHGLDPMAIVSVVVHDQPSAVAPLAQNPDVLAVEILPADAVWGQFGIRMVDVPR